jgi:hypothetical protein
MSRTNPFKRKPRHAKKTILIVGEGPTEKAFLDHIKSVFLARDYGVSVSTRPAGGGSPDQMLNKTIRWKEGFDQSFIVLDGDIPLSPQFSKKARSKRIAIIISNPCIEGEFLEVLHHAGFSKAGKSSDTCKRIFHENYLSENDKTDRNCYGRFFTQEALEKSAENVPWLRKIIEVVSGKWKVDKKH